MAVGAFIYFYWRSASLSHRDPTPAVVREPIASVTSSSSTPPRVPTRPPSLSEQQHLATVAAVSLAGAAMQSHHDELARLAMALADVNTNPKATCGDYDVAYVALRKAVLALPDAGAELGDVTQDLRDLEGARCTPGSPMTDAGE